jgi:ferredoxin/flavodoxin
MKCAVIYFSLTGNTKKVSQAIYEGISRENGQCDLFQLKSVDLNSLGKYDLLGIGTPVWGLAEAAPVRIFLESIPSSAGKHWFMFATHCADRGGVFYHMAKALQFKEAAVISCRSWYGEMWMPQYPKPYPTDGHPDGIDLSEAYEYGREVVGLSQKIFQGARDLIPQRFGQGRERLPLGYVPMRLNLEKCSYPKCRLCERRCPMGAINFEKKPFFFRQPGRCVNCLLCEMICPKGAIEAEYDREEARARETVLQGVIPLIKKATAKGYLRQLVPWSDIDVETPLYKSRKWGKHPRIPLSRLP